MKDWKKMMPTYKHQFTKIQDLVGEVDANSEWQNPHLSANEFYGSQSYKLKFRTPKWGLTAYILLILLHF